MSKPIAIVVAALVPSMGIGYKNSLPWRLRQEMKYFKSLTTQQPLGQKDGQLNAVVMGRKTWESIPSKFRPLPGRHNVVISRQVTTKDGEEKDGATFYSSVEEALKQLSQLENIARVFIMGGAEIYNHCLKQGLVNQLFITEIEHSSGDLEMDTFLDGDYIKANFRRATHAQLEEQTGMSVVEGVDEGEFHYNYALYTRV